MLSKLKISHKILLSVVAVLVLVTAGTVYVGYTLLQANVKQEVQASQQHNIALASLLLKQYFPQTQMRYNQDTQKLSRIVMEKIPTFDDNEMVDTIGMLSGETATFFVWDDKTQDYWRKTTNIIKDDGKRAIGTPLGQKGRVYPVIRSGKDYEGEATILGKDYFTYYKAVFTPDSSKPIGILYVGLEKAQFEAMVWNILTQMLLKALMVGVLGVGLIYWLLQRMLNRNLNVISEQMTQLAQGDLSFEIEGLHRADEMGDMARTLVVFKDNAQQKQRADAERKAAEDAAEENKKAAMLEMAQSFNAQVGGVIASLAEAAGNMQSNAQNMRGIAETTSRSSEEVVQSSEIANNNVMTVSAAMEEMAASSNQIASQIGSVRDKSSDTATDARNASDTVGNLKELVENIGEVVVSIKNIAGQTNLLALNATIESARAGEAGRGFAVVADEVKKLATETGQKTEEISDRILNIQTATNQSVEAMERILHHIADMDQSVTGVSTAVQEQNAATGEIARSISEASQGVTQVASIIGKVQTNADETGLSSDAVYNAAREVANLTSNLQAEVDRFLEQIRSQA